LVRTPDRFLALLTSEKLIMIGLVFAGRSAVDLRRQLRPSR
jgi:hypothetical protein